MNVPFQNCNSPVDGVTQKPNAFGFTSVASVPSVPIVAKQPLAPVLSTLIYPDILNAVPVRFAVDTIESAAVKTSTPNESVTTTFAVTVSAVSSL